MKKITLLLCLLISGLAVAQEKTTEEAPKYPQDVNKKHELKINAFTLLVAKVDRFFLRKTYRPRVFFWNFNNLKHRFRYFRFKICFNTLLPTLFF